ncbi:MAG: sulfite oxidase [Mycobacterium sp.]|jgi:hypothetical protein|nr:sulfite oxidase [Mycobacterium sp.]
MPFPAANHGAQFHSAPSQWRLTIVDAVDKFVTSTHDQLTADHPPHSVVAMLACTVNRRAELFDVRRMPGKDPWAHGPWSMTVEVRPGPISATARAWDGSVSPNRNVMHTFKICDARKQRLGPRQSMCEITGGSHPRLAPDC